MSYDRAAILRSAHDVVRRRMTPSRDFRYGDRWNNEAGGYVPHDLTYRQVFADALRIAWHEAKFIAEEEAWAASQPTIPDDIAETVANMRAWAWYEPITAGGNERYREINREADAIEEVALAAAALAAKHGEMHHVVR